MGAGAFTYLKLGHVPTRVMVLSFLMGAGSIIGVMIGAALLPLVDKHTLKALLGAILLVATCCLTLPSLFDRRNRGDPVAPLRPPAPGGMATS